MEEPIFAGRKIHNGLDRIQIQHTVNVGKHISLRGFPTQFSRQTMRVNMQKHKIGLPCVEFVGGAGYLLSGGAMDEALRS